MTERKKLLIATTNEGKVVEIQHMLGDLPFELVTLQDIVPIDAPTEGDVSLENNAVMKAQYYGEKTGLLTLADDTGVFIDALGGWPGVETARVADTDAKKCEIAIERMMGKENRRASFRCVACVFDPQEKTTYTALGEIDGEILDHVVPGLKTAFGFDYIFFVPEVNKAYSELTTTEKNGISHRGRALSKIKYYLQNQYRGKHFVVPVGLLIKDGKLLMSLRNDPHRSEFHQKWEFPGGSVELGEQIEENLTREMKEETGYQVEIVRLLQGIFVKYRPEYEYQVYLLPYVCQIVGGDGKCNDAEILDMKFLPLDEWLTMDLIGENLLMYKGLLPELKGVVKEFNL